MGKKERGIIGGIIRGIEGYRKNRRLTCIFKLLCKLQFRSRESILNMFTVCFDQLNKFKSFSKRFGM